MGLFELFILAIGLSMDAFAVAICKGLATTKLKKRYLIITGLWFGGFQALMPLIGYFLGTAFEKYVTSVDHYIAFILLGAIGANMIKESFSKQEEEPCDSFGFKTMLIMAIATSIDALAVGVTLINVSFSVLLAVSIIAIVTFVLVSVALIFGKTLGKLFGEYAEWVGAIILLFLAIKSLITAIIG